MVAEHLKYAVEGNVAVITISSPKTLNAMKMGFLPEIHRVLDSMKKDERVRCAVITGDGEKSFSSGGELGEERENCVSDHEKVSVYNELGDQLIIKIINHRVPFIAAVNGYAFGAPVGLIAACDIILASKNAVFSLPTCSLGGIPGWGCTQTVARAIGAQNVKRLLFLNERIGAQEAFRIGLVNQVFEHEKLMPAAMEMACKIASYPPIAIAYAKRAVNSGLEGTLEEGLAKEHEILKKCNTLPIFAEGISAFLEKRKPDFDGAAKQFGTTEIDEDLLPIKREKMEEIIG